MPQRAANPTRLISIVEDPDSGLPRDAIATLQVLVATLTHLDAGAWQARCRDRPAIQGE